MLCPRLPSISLLNGSVVTDSEREDAERFFIRYYLDYPEEELPYRWAALPVLYFLSYTVSTYTAETDNTTCNVSPAQIPFPNNQIRQAGTTC